VPGRFGRLVIGATSKGTGVKSSLKNDEPYLGNGREDHTVPLILKRSKDEGKEWEKDTLFQA